jgi:hypothetical protein
MNPPLILVLNRLKAKRLYPQEVDGTWMALCPNHYNRHHRWRPTLVVRLSEDGSHVHIFCTKGCRTTLILTKLGLDWDALYTKCWRLKWKEVFSYIRKVRNKHSGKQC